MDNVFIKMMRIADGIVESFQGDLLCDRKFMVEKFVEKNSHIPEHRGHLYTMPAKTPDSLLYNENEVTYPLKFYWFLRATGTHISADFYHAPGTYDINFDFAMESVLICEITVHHLSNDPTYEGVLPCGEIKILSHYERQELEKKWIHNNKKWKEAG